MTPIKLGKRSVWKHGKSIGTTLPKVWVDTVGIDPYKGDCLEMEMTEEGHLLVKVVRGEGRA